MRTNPKNVRTGFLPQEIYDAFAASDALALEIDSEAFDVQLEQDEDLQSKVSDAYYYSDGTTAKDLLDEEVYEIAVKLMKATGNYNEDLDYLKLSIWENSIGNFYLQQGHQLHPEQGVEELAEYNACLPLLEEYDKGMNVDRNADMLEVAIDYLESGDVVFYAVGLAHLLDKTNGLVDALREAGYTVELVTYYQ